MSEPTLERIDAPMSKALVDTIHAYQVAAHRAAGTTSGVTMHGTRFHEEALNEARAKQDALESMIVTTLTLATQRAEALLVINGDLARDAEQLEAECKTLEQRVEAAVEALERAVAPTEMGGGVEQEIRARLKAAEAERDALRKVDDAMVERAAKATLSKAWEESADDDPESALRLHREYARIALGAALAAQPTTEGL